MKKTSKKKKPPTADEIAQMADDGKDISKYFTNKVQMMPGIQRVNVDFTQSMLDELDATAKNLNISRQAVIKMFVRQALNQHYMAQQNQHQSRKQL